MYIALSSSYPDNGFSLKQRLIRFVVKANKDKNLLSDVFVGGCEMSHNEA